MGFDRVFIIGFGQIGKSIAKTLKTNGFQGKIFISSRKKIENFDYFDEYFEIQNYNDYNNSIIFICTPPDVIIEIIEKIIKKVGSMNCIISDVCSVKNSIFSHKNISASENFISIHPMDGGNSTDKKFFFKRKILNYVVKNDNIENSKLEDFCLFLNDFLNCKNEIIDYKKHDKIVAITSHIPNLILSVLSCNLKVKDNKMWCAIFKENNSNISVYLDDFMNTIISSHNNKLGENYNVFLQKHGIDISKDLQNPSLREVLNIDFIDDISDFLKKLKETLNVLVSCI